MRMVMAWLRLSQRQSMYRSAAQLHAHMQQATPALPPRSHAALQVRTLKAPDGWQCTQLHPTQALHKPTTCWVYLHGGAYVFPITGWHWRMLQRLAQLSGCPLLVVQYPLAPHSTCASTIGTLLQNLLHWLPPGAAWGLMGDSAGGGMALALTQAQRDAGLPLAQKLLLITPWVDVQMHDADCQRIAPHDPMLALSGIRAAGALYAGAWPAQHPWCSPVHANFHAFPPLQIWCAEHDLCTPATLRLVERAQAAGCCVELHYGAHMPHVWPLLPAPEGRRAQHLLAHAMRCV